MKVLVMSDTHGNIQRINHILGFAKKIGASATVHCGDWNTQDAVYSIKQTKIPVFAVLGNADEAHKDEIIRALQKVAENTEFGILNLELGGRKILIGHKPMDVEEGIKSGKYDVVFHGHTHQRKDRFVKNTHVINPGAVHNTENPSLAVYDTKTDKVEFLDIAV